MPNRYGMLVLLAFAAAFYGLLGAYLWALL